MKLKISDEEGISSSSTRFIVEKELEEDYLLHLPTLERKRSLREKDRKEKRQQRKEKPFNEYDWDILCRTGIKRPIKRPRAGEVFKTLWSFFKGKKDDKICRILAHVFNDQGESITAYIPRKEPDDESMSVNEESDSNVSDSENNILISYCSSDSSETKESSQKYIIPSNSVWT